MQYSSECFVLLLSTSIHPICEFQVQWLLLEEWLWISHLVMRNLCCVWFVADSVALVVVVNLLSY